METWVTASLLIYSILMITNANSYPQEIFFKSHKNSNQEEKEEQMESPRPSHKEKLHIDSASYQSRSNPISASPNDNNPEISNDNFVPYGAPTYNDKPIVNTFPSYKPLNEVSSPPLSNYGSHAIQPSLTPIKTEHYGTFVNSLYNNNPNQFETVETQHFHKVVPGFDTSKYPVLHNEDGNKHGEVHYHQHNHIHKHEHKQEHVHEHKQNHQHKHLHSQQHKHEHRGYSAHEHNHHHGHNNHKHHGDKYGYKHFQGYGNNHKSEGNSYIVTTNLR